ncbi:hypothetical protein PSTT_06393 [Puccinia striiformis]|uniref:Fungal-type protein kinase domain-containing protein n=1 Tax=Puccinia striiformis TaxID=27350 RepID=A0A2S4VK83_9BASI|nr:hypothetical protein PSTT_06393 [Puccinia striiformis]
MDNEPEDLQNSLRNILTSPDIRTVEGFFGLERSKMDKTTLFLLAKFSHQMADTSSKTNSNNPLITVIFAHETKTNQEMYEIIAEELNDHRVRTGNTSSLTNCSSHLSHFLPALRRDFTESMYTNVSGLVERYINLHHIDPALCPPPDKSFIHEKWNEKLDDASECSILEWTNSLFEYCTTWLDKQSPNAPNSRIWRSDPKAYLKGINWKRKLGGAIMHRHVAVKNHIRDILVPFVLRKDKSEARLAAFGLAKYVSEVFKAQPTRSYVVGLTLCGTWMQLWLFDRSGAVGSELFNVKANSENLEKGIDSKRSEKIQITDAPDDLEEPINSFDAPDHPEEPKKSYDAPDHPEEPKNPFINRIHRRLILKDVGNSIWEVDSPVALLEALEGCIKGHEALLTAGYLHRDISINNLMFANETDDPDQKSFVIDLDMAIAYPIQNHEDLKARTGTKFFMSSNLLLKGHPHSFIDDIESFFWVLIWICIHDCNDKSTFINKSDWNQQDPFTLGLVKCYYLGHLHLLTDIFRSQFKNSEPLICCVKEFAEIVADDRARTKESETLYPQILNIFCKAQGKPIVLAQ